MRAALAAGRPPLVVVAAIAIAGAAITGCQAIADLSGYELRTDGGADATIDSAVDAGDTGAGDTGTIDTGVDARDVGVPEGGTCSKTDDCAAGLACCDKNAPCKDTCIPDCQRSDVKCEHADEICCKAPAKCAGTCVRSCDGTGCPSPDDVCCPSSLGCAGLCVPDCRKAPCPSGVTCNVDSGVCNPT